MNELCLLIFTGDIHSLARNIVGKKNEKHHISESDLKSRSDKHLNIQVSS